MRVRNLNIYLREQGLLRQGDLSVLRGMRVGIDAVYFFRSLKGICDPLSEVGGSLPPTYISVFEENVAQLERLGIQPLFVFEGMQSKSHILLSAQLMTLSVAEGWLAYSRGDLPTAIGKFLQTSLIFNEDLIQLLIHMLRARGKDTIRCPYFAAAQLSYFCAEGIVDAIVGPASLLLFGVPRCIVSLDFPRGSFEWVELKEVLTRLDITHPQLVDVCLMAGTEHCLSFPSQSTFSFAHCVDMIKQGPIAKHLSQLPQREGLTEYVDGYCVTKALVTYPMILDNKGVVRPLQKGAKIPMDYHKIVGARIPHGIYHLLGQGVISPKIPFALASGEWVDDFSLTDAIELRELLQDSREYKCRALGLAVFRLDPVYQSRQIRFQGHVAFVKGHPPIKQSSIAVIPNTCSTRMLSQQAMGELSAELVRQRKDKVDAEFVLDWHFRLSSKMLKEVTPTMASEAITGMFSVPSGSQKLSEEHIFSANMWCILLDSLGYFARMGGATAFGKVLANSRLGLQGLLFMEVMKFGLFTGESFEVPVDVAISHEVINKSRGSLPQDVFEVVNLIARVACLHPATVDSTHWRGEIDYLISNYVAHVKVLRRSFNYLVEGTIIMLGGLAKGVEPPYMLESNCFMANVIKWLLTQDDQRDGPAASNMLETLHNKFPNIADMKQNLQSFADFWSKISTLLHDLQAYVHIEALATFDRGTKMLRASLGPLGISL
ncbi:XPG N-terminal domain-containing protein [Babesia caballi]|uniref:XPG N-terminal domain-containing protein n=1 Tax=Babesia caballi TaxID=5871 RepID=A0AAV4LX39_BABCB|nr:XPG N-terminal domain-containing protein [Babesia caballi]